MTLIDAQTALATGQQDVVAEIPANTIDLSRNIRRTITIDDDFQDSIATQGIKIRCIVEPHPEPEYGYAWLCIAGHRRITAACIANGPTASIPCIVQASPTDAERVVSMLIENMQRADLDPVDEGYAYLRVGAVGWTITEIADSVGVPEQRVRARIKLTELSDDVVALLHNHEITLEAATAIASITDPGVQLLAATKRPSWQSVSVFVAQHKAREAATRKQTARVAELRRLGHNAAKGAPSGARQVADPSKTSHYYGSGLRPPTTALFTEFTKSEHAHIKVDRDPYTNKLTETWWCLPAGLEHWRERFGLENPEPAAPRSTTAATPTTDAEREAMRAQTEAFNSWWQSVTPSTLEGEAARLLECVILAAAIESFRLRPSDLTSVAISDGYLDDDRLTVRLSAEDPRTLAKLRRELVDRWISDEVHSFGPVEWLLVQERGDWPELPAHLEQQRTNALADAERLRAKPDTGNVDEDAAAE